MSGDRVAPGRPASGTASYPMFVDLAGRLSCVVGGGPVATGRVLRLLEHGAEVRVVSPQITSELSRMVEDGAVADHRPRTYRPEDLEGCFLVIAATHLASVNRMVWQDAEARNMLCNVVDGPPAGNFIVPSLVRRGDLALAVTTGGASPVVSRLLALRLGEELGPEWEDLAALLGELRDELKERHPDVARRRAAVEALMGTRVLGMLAEGDRDGARALAREALDLGVRA